MSQPFEFTPDQTKWIEDLLTTDAGQVEGYLHLDNSFCCLGRACVVLEVPQYRKEGALVGYGVAGDWDTAELPTATKVQLNLRSQHGLINMSNVTAEWRAELDVMDQAGTIFTLAALNDSGQWPFEKIGRFIKENPEAVFTNHPVEEVAA